MVVLVGIMRLVVNKDRLLLKHLLRRLVLHKDRFGFLLFHNDGLLVMYLDVLLMMLLMMHKHRLLVVLVVLVVLVGLVVHINWLLFMYDLHRLLINNSGRLLLDKHRSWLLIDYFLLNGLHIFMGHNLLIFMNLLWLVLMMLIMIAWPQLFFDCAVLMFCIPAMWLLINAFVFFVVRIIFIVVVGV